MIDDYNTKLETLRASLLATKQTSTFADEERLRERITKIYAAVSNQEAAPSNLQIENVAVLSKEVTNAMQVNDNLTKTYYAKVREAIEKNKSFKLDIKPKLNKDSNNK